MELWQLRTFKAVAKTLHFTRASEELNLSQPAVSHQIKALEDELNEPLFNRERSGVTLTAAGRVMLEHAVQMLEMSEKLKREIKDAAKSARGSITLGCPNRSLENPFLEFYEGFTADYKEIELIYRNEPASAEVFEGVKNGRIDVGVVLLEPDKIKFETLPYGTFRMQFVVGPGHRFANRKSISAKLLENERWALFEPEDEMRQFVEASFRASGRHPKSIYTTNDGSVIRDLVTTNNFVSLLPSRGISKELENGTLVNVCAPELESVHEAFLIWKAGKATPAVNSLVRFVLEHELPGISLSGLKNNSDTR